MTEVARKVVSPVASAARADPIGGAAFVATALLVAAAAAGGLVVTIAASRLGKSP